MLFKQSLAAVRIRQCLCLLAVTVPIALSGCGKSNSKLNEPIRYTSTDKLRERLEEVAQWGDGGSSLGGIPESIEDITKTEPEKGKLLLQDFQRLNTASDKETRKTIAKEMAEKLK
ncbi:MAG: hypothetical protein WCJ09_17595 [Planctomycetota bacterium]